MKSLNVTNVIPVRIILIMQLHRIGEDVEFEKGWDTPTLREVWRTAPYLFDGRAATMKEVFEVYKHGIDKRYHRKKLMNWPSM